MTKITCIMIKTKQPRLWQGYKVSNDMIKILWLQNCKYDNYLKR